MKEELSPIAELSISSENCLFSNITQNKNLIIFFFSIFFKAQNTPSEYSITNYCTILICGFPMKRSRKRCISFTYGEITCHAVRFVSNTFNYGHILSVSLQALLEVAGMRHLNFNIITYQSREEIISLILVEQST